MSKKQLASGLPIIAHHKATCESCLMAKQHQAKIPKQTIQCATRPFQLVHSDLCGPISEVAKLKYIMTFIDNYSQLTWTYFLTHKSDAFDSFKEF